MKSLLTLSCQHDTLTALSAYLKHCVATECSPSLSCQHDTITQADTCGYGEWSRPRHTAWDTAHRPVNDARDGSTALVVDLTGVGYCDSAAVRALFTLAATTDLTMVVAPSGHITTLLGISGLDRVATVITKQ